MSAFGTSLRERAGGLGGPRRWVFVPYDQLHDGVGPLQREPATELGVVLIESRAKATRRRYHKQKLALVMTNMRHFALEQAERGVAVRYVDAGDDDYATTLRALHAELGAMRVMRPAERELRVELQPLVDDGTLEELPHDGWLTSEARVEYAEEKEAQACAGSADAVAKGSTTFAARGCGQCRATAALVRRRAGGGGEAARYERLLLGA